MKLHNICVKQVKTMNVSWKDNRGILSWKVLPRENCKLLPDLGLKLLRKSFGLSMRFLTQCCVSAVKGFNHAQFSFFFCVINPSSSLLFPTPLSCPCPSQGGCTVHDEQRNVTEYARHKNLSIYHISSISWWVLRKQEISRNTECFVCWTGLQIIQLSLPSQNF